MSQIKSCYLTFTPSKKTLILKVINAPELNWDINSTNETLNLGHLKKGSASLKLERREYYYYIVRGRIGNRYTC